MLHFFFISSWKHRSSLKCLKRENTHKHTHLHLHIIPVPYSIIHVKLFDRSPCAYTVSVGGIMSVPVVVKVQIKLIQGLA